MIGTLAGLVIKLGNMSDPKAIGPAMAVALLTTMYGQSSPTDLFAYCAKPEKALRWSQPITSW